MYHILESNLLQSILIFMVEVLTDIKRKINKRFTTQRRRKKKPQQNQKLNHKMDQDSYHFTALFDMSRLLYFGSRDKIYTCSILQYHTNTKMTLSSLYAFGK